MLLTKRSRGDGGRMGQATREQCSRELRRSASRGRCAVPRTRQQADRFRYLVKKGELVNPYPGLFADAERWNALTEIQRHRHLMRTLSSEHPSWVFVGASAAAAHGLEVCYADLETVRVAKLGNAPTFGTDRSLHMSLHSSDTTTVDGMRVTTLSRTVVDCMRKLPFSHALVIADSYLRRTFSTREQLVNLVDKPRHGLDGIAHARIVASYADGRAENGGESFARARMIELGFDVPELQVEVYDPVEKRLYRVDFAWTLPDSSRVFGELDGWEKYLNPQMNGGSTVGAFASERQRESRLTLAGGRVVRFRFSQVVDKGYFERLLTMYGIPRSRPPRLPSAHEKRATHHRARRCTIHDDDGWTIYATSSWGPCRPVSRERLIRVAKRLLRAKRMQAAAQASAQAASS